MQAQGSPTHLPELQPCARGLLVYAWTKWGPCKSFLVFKIEYRNETTSLFFGRYGEPGKNIYTFKHIGFSNNMHLNIIHLPHRTDRFELLKNELITQAISSYTIWNGIIDPNISCKGISRAHKQVVRFAKENNLREILIAEDDLKFTDKGAFDFFLQNKPIEFDIYLSSIYYDEINNANVVEDFSGLTFSCLVRLLKKVSNLAP